MSRPRPLTKPQREILDLCRGEGVPTREFMDRQCMRLVWQIQCKGWIDWRPSEQGEDGKQKGPTIYFLTPAGEAKLVENAPPPPPGRIACVNPRCWKTEPASKFPGCSKIICSPCFRMAPELRQEYRHLWARYRKVERLARKHDRDATTAMHRLGMQIETNWRKITEFFTAPEKPEGMDTFLEEMGWNDEGIPDEKHADRD